MAADALLFSLLGGLAMGTYPVPIKSPTVLAAKVHPIVFQCYKSFWVFSTGWLFLLPNALAKKSPIFEFSWWAVVSAAAWVPAGLFAIAAVPRIGMALTGSLAAGISALLTFLVFWLLLGESMRVHGEPGHQFYLAPAYLVGIIGGVVGIAAVPRCGTSSYAQPSRSAKTQIPGGQKDSRSPKAHIFGQACADSNDESDAFTQSPGLAQEVDLEVVQVEDPASIPQVLLGLFYALLCGVCNSFQFGAVSLGRRWEQRAARCEGNMEGCPPKMREQFNNFGSWMTSFGIGAACVTAAFLLVLASLERGAGRPYPDMHVQVLALPGSIAGICWVVGNFFCLAAVVAGGQSVTVPANVSITLLTAGLWGSFYYKEVRSGKLMVIWWVMAIFLLACIVLLSQEKEG